MKLILKIFFFLMLATGLNAQLNMVSDPDVPPVNYGGKEQVEQVVKNQMMMGANYLHIEDKLVTIYFTVTQEGKVVNPFFKDNYETHYQTESKRLLKFFLFEPAKKANLLVDAYGSLTFNFAPSKYRSQFKERNKVQKPGILPVDTSFIVYEVADKSPEYYKGDDELKDFILTNIDYPPVAVSQNIEGTVNVSFVVETNGTVSNIRPLSLVGAGCTGEALRIISLTKWKPAQKGNKLVRYKMTYPITFMLKNVNRDNSSSGQ